MRRRSFVDIVGPKGTASTASVRVCFLPYWYYQWGCQEAITYFNVDAIMNVALYLMTSSSWYRPSRRNRNPRYEIFLAINQWPWFGPHYHPFDITCYMACQSSSSTSLAAGDRIYRIYVTSSSFFTMTYETRGNMTLFEGTRRSLWKICLEKGWLEKSAKIEAPSHGSCKNVGFVQPLSNWFIT